jgi:predicted dehydrogenase
VPVGVAIVGIGFGARVALPAFAAVPGARVRAVVGRSAEGMARVAREHDVPLATTRLEDALADPAVHLVHITTPPDLHAAQAVAALAAGKHVLCEKPFAFDAAAADAMCAAVPPGRLALVDHQLRFAPGVQRLRRLLADGYVGTPLYATLDVATPRELERGRSFGWWQERGRGGGALGAYGSHGIDLLRLLLGEPESVCSTLHTFVTERPAAGDVRPRRVDSDDWAAFWLRCGRRRAAAQISAVAHGGMGLQLSLFGTDGALHLDSEGTLRGRRGGGGIEDLAAPERLPEPLRGRVPDTVWSSAFAVLAQAVVAAIAAGDERVPGAATFADGLAVQRVLDAVRAAAASGGWEPVPAR